MRPFRIILLAGAVVAVAGCSDSTPVASSPVRPEPAPLLSAAPGKAVKGSYLVVLREGADPRAAAAVAGVSPRFVYQSAVNGFAATLDEGQLHALRRNPAVEYVEEDQVVEPFITQTSAPWGLDRIDQRSLPLSGTYTYNTNASNVYAYVIDTGISVTHPQFGGRAVNAYDATGENGAICDGHGTHVAGIIGGTTFGVAKGVRLRGVKVVPCAISGTMAMLVAGVTWVHVNHVKPAVVNLSVGGSYSAALNNAVNSLVNSGLFVAVAAGNENQNACNFSPASATYAVTVAASTSADARATYSNYGPCVDLYAPGTSITSAWPINGTNTISGTSMAAAHVTGVAALFTSGQVHPIPTAESWIKGNATTNVITGNPVGTPNLLLFKANL